MPICLNAQGTSCAGANASRRMKNTVNRILIYLLISIHFLLAHDFLRHFIVHLHSYHFMPTSSWYSGKYNTLGRIGRQKFQFPALSFCRRRWPQLSDPYKCAVASRNSDAAPQKALFSPGYGLPLTTPVARIVGLISAHVPWQKYLAHVVNRRNLIFMDQCSFF